MELTDFCFVGHVTIGPRIISKLEQKGVLNKTNIRGEQNSRVYYVVKNKNGTYEIASEGVQSAFGKHILSIRENITVDIYQNFLQRLSEVFIPEEPKKRTKKEFTEEQTQKIIDLYKIGTPIKEIAETFPNRDYKAIYNRIQYLKRLGRLPSNAQEKKSQKQKEHLWTIKDAKDGDVLAVDGGSGICIFDGTVEEGIYPFAYCGLTRYGFEFYDRKLPFTHDKDIHPATKEQRDLLFQKMKEAGYKWDVEKKELRKIEQEQTEKEDKLEDVVETSVGMVRKTSAVMDLTLNLRVKSAVSLAAAMLVMGVEYTDDQLAERAVSIADKILTKISV